MSWFIDYIGEGNYLFKLFASLKGFNCSNYIVLQQLVIKYKPFRFSWLLDIAIYDDWFYVTYWLWRINILHFIPRDIINIIVYFYKKSPFDNFYVEEIYKHQRHSFKRLKK